MSFDNVCKRLAELYPYDFASWLLGEPVAQVEVWKTELGNDPIRADSVIFLRLAASILHLEFQTTPKSKPPLPLRMLDYWVRLHRDTGLPIIQFVVLLSETNEEVPTEFRALNTWHRYNVIRMSEQNPELFLQLPGLLPLATLAHSEEPERLLAQVTERAVQIQTEDGSHELVGCVALLAGLRFDRQLIYQMLPEEIMEESVIYQDAVRKGEVRGEIRGEIRGEWKGMLKTVLNLLTHRFGQLAPKVEGQIITLKQESLSALSIAQMDFQGTVDLEDWLAAHATRM